MTRRQLLAGSLALCLTPRLWAQPSNVSADEALRLLMEGNARYVAGRKQSERGAERRQALSQSQYPFAAILGCADSRVAPEVLFDAGIGELFVVRVAGNIASRSNYGILGSLEYAVAVLRTPLIYVLGHENCGAVDAAIKSIKDDSELPGSVEGIVEAIRPAARASKNQPGDPLHNAIVANVREVKGRLTDYSGILKASGVRIEGGVYDLATGKVTPV